MPYDIRLPDGTLVQNIPDEITPEEAKRRIMRSRPDLLDTPKPEQSGFLRQAADLPVGLARGAVQGVRMIADAFGAGSGVSESIKGAEKYIGSLMSAQAKNDEQEIARIMKDAEDKGAGEQVRAALKAFSVAPVDLITQGLGTAAPVILGTLSAKVLGAGALATKGIGLGLGAGMGAGVVKGTIYEETKEALKDVMPEEQAEARAQLAQSYGGKNLDMILAGAALGGLASTTGVEKALSGQLARSILARTAGKEVAEETAQKALLPRVLSGAAAEAVPEFLQAGQEQLAANVALQREGFDVDTMRGVVGAGTLEGLVGAGMGAGVSAFQRGPSPVVAEEEPDQTVPDEPTPPTPPVAPPGDLLTLTNRGITEADIAATGVKIPAANVPFVRSMLLGKTLEEVRAQAQENDLMKSQKTPIGRVVRALLDSPQAAPVPDVATAPVALTAPEAPVTAETITSAPDEVAPPVAPVTTVEPTPDAAPTTAPQGTPAATVQPTTTEPAPTGDASPTVEAAGVRDPYAELAEQWNAKVAVFKAATPEQQAAMRPEMDALSAKMEKARQGRMQEANAEFKRQQAERNKKEQAEKEVKYGAMPIGTRIGMIAHPKDDTIYWEKTGDNEWTRFGMGSEQPTKTSAEMQGDRVIQSPEVEPQPTQPLASAEATWNAMTPQEREQMALRAGVQQKPAANHSKRPWNAIPNTVRQAVSSAIQIEPELVSGEPPAITTPDRGRPQLPEQALPIQQQLEEAEKARAKIKPTAGLRNLVKGRLSQSEAREIDPETTGRFLMAPAGQQPTSLSTMVADGTLNAFLPFDMRTDSTRFDPAESTEYIRQKLIDKQYDTFERGMETAALDAQIEELRLALQEHIDFEEVNLLIQEAVDEQRRIDEAAESDAAQGTTGTATAAPAVAPELTAEEEDRLEREAIQAENTLTQPTPESLAEQERKAKKKEQSDKKAKADADAKAAKDRERKEISQASVAAAEDFQLGQDPMANLTGQRDLLENIEAGIPKTIEVDGAKRPTRNADGSLIDTTVEKIRNFWKWVSSEGVWADSQGRPIPLYHGTNQDIEAFDPSRTGGLINLTTKTFTGNKYAGALGGSRQRSQEIIFVDQDTGESFTPRTISGIDILDFEGSRGTILTTREVQTKLEYGDIAETATGANVLKLYAKGKVLDLQTPEGVSVLASLPVPEGGGRKAAAARSVIEQAKKGRFNWIDTKDEGTVKHWQDILNPMLKERGYYGIKFSDDNTGDPYTLAMFGRRQIKSAIGNTGAYSPTSPSLVENIDRLTREPSAYGETTRSPSFTREVKKLQKLEADGKITPEVLAERLEALVKADKDAALDKELKPRERGADYIRQRLLEAKRRGDLSGRAVDMAEWFILKNPALVDDLGISIRSGEGGRSGDYNPLPRVIGLIKGSENDATTVHEILHHLERMMPAKVQQKIRQDWFAGLTKAIKAADAGSTRKKALEAIMDYHMNGNRKALNEARQAIIDGEVDYDIYQFFNPSEFWAVNATAIMERRFDASSSVLGSIKNWLRELGQKIKSVFGLDSEATLIRALDSLIKGDGKFQSSEMLMEGLSVVADVDALQNIEPMKKVVSDPSRAALSSRARRLRKQSSKAARAS
jgi:rRNA maturation endonuclease Nob1